MLPLTALIYGTLAAGAAFLLEILFLTGFSSGLTAFATGALIEEGMKLLFLFQYQKRFPPSIPSSIPFQLFSFSLFGIGFALIEIFLALPPDIGILSALICIHTFTSLLLGYALLSRERSLIFLPVGIISAVCAHTAYNLFIASLQ